MTSEERIRKLREEVQSLRSLLDRTKRVKPEAAPAPEKPAPLPRLKKTPPPARPARKREDDDPPF